MKKNENFKLINLESNTSNLDVNKPLIFRKKINNKSRIIPLKTIINKFGPTRHFTPAAQEWFNSVYAYNKFYTKLLPIADKNLMKLVKSYFNLYITKFLYYEEKKSKKLSTRFRRLSVKRIFVGKGDLKHTSSKVIITLYVYNYEKKKFLVEQVKEITNWVKYIPMSDYSSKSLVRSVVKDNLYLSYKRWFSMKSYSLLYKDESLSNKKWYSFLNKEEAFILERFYFNKFFGPFSLTIKNQLSSLNKIISKAKLVKYKKPLFKDNFASDKKPFYIFKPLYNDYVKFISNVNLAGNKKPSLDNFLSLIRNVSIESLHNLKNNNIDFNNKTLYLDSVKNYLSKFFVLNKNLTKLTLNVDNLKKLKNPYIDLDFSDKKLKYRFAIFKSKLYTFDGKDRKTMKILKIPTFDKFLSLLRNINIESLIDLKRKDINFRDITLYIHYVNNYLSKYFFVNKNFIFHIIDSINNTEKDIDFKDKTIYLDYYRYISCGKFVEGKIPTFDEFLSVLQNISINNLNDLKNKYKDFNNKTMYIEGLGDGDTKQKKNLSLYNMRNILFNYDFDKLNQHAINFKRETFIHYLKIKFITLRMLIFNQNKFKISFLKYLTRLVSNLYNKEVVFNIVNLKKLHLNSDIFTQAVSLKLKNRNNRIYRVLKNSLKRVKVPYVNRAREKYNKFDIEQLLINKVRNIRINSILVNYITNKDPLNKLLSNIYTKNDNIKVGSVNPEYKDAQSFVNSAVQDGKKQNYLNDKEYLVLNSLKHIGFAGVRIEAKGRLTRRFTASRSVFKMKWKGGLKNVDSSFKGLSAVILRGHAKSNVQYSRVNSKNRNGAFGVKGWVGNK